MIRALTMAVALAAPSEMLAQEPKWQSETWVALLDEQHTRIEWLPHWTGSFQTAEGQVFPTVAVRVYQPSYVKNPHPTDDIIPKSQVLFAIDCSRQETAQIFLGTSAEGDAGMWASEPRFDPLYLFEGDEGRLSGKLPKIVAAVCGEKEN